MARTRYPPTWIESPERSRCLLATWPRCERSGDSIQVGGYRVRAIRPGSDPGVWVSRPDAESAFTAPNQPDRGDQEGSAASNPRDGSGPVDRHWFGPPTAWPMPSEKAAHS